MTTLDQWAHDWGISAAALIDLRHRLGDDHSNDTLRASEAAVQADVRLLASQAGDRLWRNNVGAGTLEDGCFVRWGLANESARVNEHIKSADLIGIRPVVITPDRVGQTIGQFVSRECKAKGWKLTAGDKRGQAQMRWAELIMAFGGDAKITTGEY